MSEGAVFLVIMYLAFPTVLIVALVVKLWEVRKAKAWPSTAGKVIGNGIKSHKKKPGDPGYNFGDTEVSNEPFVQYEYKVGNRSYRCQRITIGEKTSEFELESILQRYPVGAEVTVYYDPAKPTSAVLERDLDQGVLVKGMGCLLLFFLGAPALGALLYFKGIDWLNPYLADPEKAPFVAAATGFGLLVVLFACAFTQLALQASRWPVASGRIVASEVEAFQRRQQGRRSWRTHYKPSVVYTYEVDGRKYSGDRVRIGVTLSGTLPGFAKRLAAQYPVGSEVEVYYNPKNRSESALHPYSRWHYLLWMIAACMFALAWGVATGGVG